MRTFIFNWIFNELILTGLFVISGYSGKASGRFFGGFGGDFPVVFGLLPDENSEKNPLKSL